MEQETEELKTSASPKKTKKAAPDLEAGLVPVKKLYLWQETSLPWVRGGTKQMVVSGASSTGAGRGGSVEEVFHCRPPHQWAGHYLIRCTSEKFGVEQVVVHQGSAYAEI